MPDLADRDQLWTIYDLFTRFGFKDTAQMRADAARIIKIDYLPDMRELTHDEAKELIGELRRALAQERVSDD